MALNGGHGVSRPSGSTSTSDASHRSMQKRSSTLAVPGGHGACLRVRQLALGDRAIAPGAKSLRTLSWRGAVAPVRSPRRRLRRDEHGARRGGLPVARTRVEGARQAETQPHDGERDGSEGARRHREGRRVTRNPRVRHDPFERRAQRESRQDAKTPEEGDCSRPGLRGDITRATLPALVSEKNSLGVLASWRLFLFL